MTLREHLVAAAYTVPAALSDLMGPPLPPHTEQAWAAFVDLSVTRGASPAGLTAITFAEMRAYQAMTRTRLTALDVALVREADAAFLAETRSRMSSGNAPSVPEGH